MGLRASRLLFLALVAAFAATRAQATTPSLCDSLDEYPVNYQIGYQSGIQGIFNNYCTECHEGDAPSAGMDLSAGHSWSSLVNHVSSQDANLTRVVPNHPEQSLLFHKVNCDQPGIGHRMPLFRTEMSGLEQSLLYDWIAGGAPVGSMDVLFRGEFELRN